ncbi:MAG: hypothetical protein HYS04_05960, partial [Acidobacteria bacterium]|nr:hypothetical protein [Acidobacteriota bacterium]
IGFGPVVPQPPSGSAAPIEPLSFVTDSMACELDTGVIQPIEVLFAGLAPQLTGVYQFDLRLPTTITRPRARLQCRIRDQSAGSGLLWVTGN